MSFFFLPRFFCLSFLSASEKAQERIRQKRKALTVDDRRAHVARAVRLHPPVVGEGEALELLAKVLDHVGALGLAVDEHVDADALLLLDAEERGRAAVTQLRVA